ncbi:MAG TPA: DoxX family protein [Chryseosolibacter sp.]
MLRIDSFFEPLKGYANFFLRLVIGWRLIDGTQDNVFSWARMLEFRDFLAVHGVPFPLVAANISVYAQFVCGILFIIGWMIRPAAMIMIVNFIVALLVAHIGLSFEQSFDAWMMLFGSIFFLFSGAGNISVDELRKDRK